MQHCVEILAAAMLVYCVDPSPLAACVLSERIRDLNERSRNYGRTCCSNQSYSRSSPLVRRATSF